MTYTATAPTTRAAAIFALFCLLLGACGGSDDGQESAASTTSQVSTPTTAAADATSSTEAEPDQESEETEPVDPLSLPPPQAQESPAIIDRLDRGRQPCALEVTDSGRVFVTYLGGNDIAEMDPETGAEIQRLRTGSSPCGIAAIDDQLWVAELGTDSIVRLDPDDGEVLATVELGADPWDLQPGAGYLWAIERNPGVLVRIDPASGAEAGRVDGIGSGSGLVVAGGLVWVADELLNEVVRVDPETLAIVDRTAVGMAPKWFGANDDSVWVSTSAGIQMLDLDTAEPVLTVDAGDAPLDLFVTETDVWVPDSGPGIVYRFDAETGDLLDRLKLSTGVYVIEAVATDVWVLNFQFQARGHIHRLDPSVPFNGS